VIENETFHNATGKREVGPVKVADLQLTVAGLSQVLKDWGFCKWPQAGDY